MDKEIIRKIEEQVEQELNGKVDKNSFGYIHIFEKRKQELLKEKGIDWKTSKERYSGISID